MSFGWVKKYFVPSTDNAYRPHVLRRPWLLFFLAVIFCTEGFLIANLIGRQSSANFLAAVVPAEIVALTNTERTTNNVGTLIENKLLDTAAQAKAQDMAKNSYFSHKGPDGKTPWQWVSDAGYKYQWAGENLAVRFIDSHDVVRAWMASPTHRANIVKPVYTEIGVGVAQGVFQGAPATYVVQYFGAPATSDMGAAVDAAQFTQTPASGSLSIIQSIMRQVVRVFAEPQSASNWILGLAATLLVLALAMTFFVHVHVQHGHMLAQGSVVAGLAIIFLLLNMSVVPGALSSSSQSAAVAQFIPTHASGSLGVVIDADAASTGYTLFP